jgi:hypothetical protein
MTTAIGTWAISPFSGMVLVVGERDHYLQIVSEDDDHMAYIPAGLERSLPWRLAERAPASAEVVAEYLARGEAKRAVDEAERKARQDARKRQEREWKAWLQANRPADAVAILVAELVEDDCDSQTDHYGTKTLRRVFLGWSRSKRDSFLEMRKAAATFAPTADLATASKGAEHREKYSQGHGYYLKDGGSYSSGWEISKEPLNYTPTACEVPGAEVSPSVEQLAAALTVPKGTILSKPTPAPTANIRPTTLVCDDEPIEVSTARKTRIAVEVLDTLRHNLSAHPSDSELIACANNIAAGWGEYGVSEEVA